MKTAMLSLAMFVSGAIAGGLLGLLVSLPPSTAECGDECGGRALTFAFHCGLASGFLLAVASSIVTKARMRKRTH
jgi:hypothetical protein